MERIGWFDRAGKAGAVLGEALADLNFSPDRKSLAVTTLDASGNNDDVWICDTARGVPTRFTLDPATGN